MPLTKEQVEALDQELANNGGQLTKAAGRLSLDLGEAITHVRQKGINNIKIPRKELEKYIVAHRKGVGNWIATEAMIVARAKYDAGLVEMCTYRFEDIFYLLSIPRKHRARRRPYFGRFED